MEQTANFYDVVVIGGGPAGLTAALYLARARYRVVVVEKDHFGGQITITSEVVNYPGVGRTSGTELTETMRKQAEGFGAEFLLAEVTGLELSGDIKTVRTGRGDLRCFGVLLATGAHPRMVGRRIGSAAELWVLLNGKGSGRIWNPPLRLQGSASSMSRNVGGCCKAPAISI